jgi:hypothetical protein
MAKFRKNEKGYDFSEGEKGKYIDRLVRDIKSSKVDPIRNTWRGKVSPGFIFSSSS